MSKKPPLVNKYQRELSRYDENQRQLAGLEKLSATFLRKISSTLRILENLEHDDLIKSIFSDSEINSNNANNTADNNNNNNTIYPPMLSEEAIRIVPALQKYNDRILEICNKYSNDKNFSDMDDMIDDEIHENNSNNNEDNEDITPSLKESYNFIKEIPLLHKDLEGQS